MPNDVYKEALETNEEVNRGKLEWLVEKTERQLHSVRTVFPLTFFPHKIVVDENKVSIVKGVFFFTHETFTFFIKDVKTVQVHTGILFASLILEVSGYEKNPAPVNYLWKSDAIKIRNIIIGLTAAINDSVDTTVLEVDELKQKVEKIGHSKEAQSSMSSVI